jgi:hypothetical protein
MAFDKFYDREKGAARDYVIPTGQDAVKNFKKKVVTELWPQLDVWCQYRTREIRENTTFDRNVPDADDEIPLDEFEHLAIEQWVMYQSKIGYAKMQKHKKTKLQRDMRKTERGLGAMPPGAFGIPSASAGSTSLTFGAAASGEDNDEEDAGDDSYSEEDTESDDGVATDPEGALSRGQKRKRQRIRKGQKPPAAGDANFTTASVRGIPFGINMNDIAQEMKKIQTEFMNQDVFQSSTMNADKKEKREELKALYEAIEHYKLMGDSGRVAKLTEKAKAKENEMFGV